MTKILLNKTKFDAVFREHYQRLCAYAFSYMNEEDISEELVQEVFVNFWQHRKKLKHEQALTAFLYKMVRNECLNYIKQKKTEFKYKNENEYLRKADELCEDSDEYREELSEKLKQAVNKLPEGRREIFVLSRYQGLKYKEISEELGIAVKTVENQMAAAMKFIKEELSEYIVTLIVLVNLMRNYL